MSKPPPPPSLDRLTGRRADRDFLHELHGADGARFLLVAGSRAAIVSSDDRKRATVRWFTKDELAAHAVSTQNAIFLGGDRVTFTGRFAVIVDDEAAAAHADALAPLVDLRSLITQGVVGQDGFSLLAEAKMVSEWHASAKYCGRCGSATKITDGGWKIVCTSCATTQFPRVDPVVIMLVVHGDNIALAHEPRFPEKMYSTLAGFVEPGEDLRTAVRRETREEIGIEIGQVDFFGSQPWPFPHALMMGCVAEALGETMVIDRTEISDARWFGRSEVKDMLAGKHPRGLFLPGGHAIAHALIRQWAEQPVTGTK